MFNQNFTFPQGSGYQYVGGAPQMPTKINNFLTNEEINRLIQKENAFSLQLTETEVLRAKCNHRTADGLHDALTEDANGISTCAICGYQFKPVSIQTTVESIQEACETVTDILQTIKLLFVGLPADAAEYFQIIPLIDKLPQLFQRAAKEYSKYEGANQFMYNNKNMSTMSLFNMLCGGGFGQAYANPVDPNAAQQPYGFAPQATAPMGAAPQFNPYAVPNYGMPSNGFGYGYAPQTTGYQFPGQPTPAPAAPATEAAPAATAETTQTFKA